MKKHAFYMKYMSILVVIYDSNTTDNRAKQK